MFVVESATVLKVLEQVRKSPVRVALVVDEYGTITGLITLYDLLQAIIGQLPPEDQTEQPLIVQRDDGTWLVDGMIPIYDFKEYFQIEKLTGDEEEADYNTLAGFILSQMGQIPKIGDHFQSEGIRYEVVDMDRHRIDRILVSKVS